MTQFTEIESFKHKCAKELLFNWLVLAESRSKKECQLMPFQWNKSYGVFLELKFYRNSTAYYFEEGKQSGGILFVPDIVVFHEGCPLYIIEVVNKNPVSPVKLSRIKKFFRHRWIEVHEVDTEEILRQTKIPAEIETKLIYKH